MHVEQIVPLQLKLALKVGHLPGMVNMAPPGSPHWNACASQLMEERCLCTVQEVNLLDASQPLKRLYRLQQQHLGSACVHAVDDL